MQQTNSAVAVVDGFERCAFLNVVIIRAIGYEACEHATDSIARTFAIY